MCAVKHTKRIPLKTARQRADLTQAQLEVLSGVDRTRISKLERRADVRTLKDTYDSLVAALRKANGLGTDEQLVFGKAS